MLGGEEFQIKAEKYGSSGTSLGDRAGIHVTRPLNIRNKGESVQRRSSKGGQILMKDLIKTLTDHTPNYLGQSKLQGLCTRHLCQVAGIA